MVCPAGLSAFNNAIWTMPGPIGLPFGRQFDFAMFIVQHEHSLSSSAALSNTKCGRSCGVHRNRALWEESHTQCLNQTITYCGYGGVTGVFYLYCVGILGGYGFA